MAGLRCASCGAEVSPFADRCARCGADPEVTVVELGGDGAHPAASGGRRSGGRRPWLPVLVAVAVVWALFVLVGVLGGDDRDDAASDEAGQGTATTPVSIRLPRGTTTTIVPVLPDAPVLGEPTGLHLLADTPGGLLDVDLDTGVVERHELGGRLLGGDGRGVLVESATRLAWHPFPLDTAQSVPLGEEIANAWLLEGTNGVWVDQGGRFDLLGLDGTGLRASLVLPGAAYPVGMAGDQLIVAGAGGAYTVDPDGAIEDLGAAQVVAVGHGRALLDRCDSDLQCERVVLDVATGTDRPMPDLPPVSLVRGLWLGPGGRILVASINEGGLGLLAVDGDSVVELLAPGEATPESVSSAAFSLDGRWVAVSGNGSAWLGSTSGAVGVSVELGGGFADGVILLVPVGG